MWSEGDANEVDLVHTGPGTLAGRYLRRFWHPIYWSEKLAPGRPTRVRVMGEDFTLYRGMDGRTHLAPPRCPHRGMSLALGSVEGNCIRCPYHGWMFDETGQCVDMPAEDPSFPPKVRIRSYATHEYLGFVFAYLGEGEAPPFPRYPQLEEDGVIENVSCMRPCNHFQLLENMVDPAHFFLHNTALITLVKRDGLPTFTVDETDWGVQIHMVRTSGEPLVQQVGLPNVWMFKIPTHDQKTRFHGTSTDVVLWGVPIDDVSHQVFYIYNVRPKDKAAYLEARGDWKGRDVSDELNELVRSIVSGERYFRDVTTDPLLLTTMEDMVAQIGQGAIADRSTWRLGKSDAGVILLHRIWKRELRALAEARPLKEWHLTDKWFTNA